MTRTPESKENISTALKSLPGWDHKDHKLFKNWVFRDFIEAFGFMTQVALLAEKADHHPNWSNVYNRLTIELTTHDAGNQVTQKDIALARQIESLFSQPAQP